jgi:hypothetical protein
MSRMKELINRFGMVHDEEIQALTFFIPRDIERNFSIMNIDITGVSLSTVWIA